MIPRGYAFWTHDARPKPHSRSGAGRRRRGRMRGSLFRPFLRGTAPGWTFLALIEKHLRHVTANEANCRACGKPTITGRRLGQTAAICPAAWSHPLGDGVTLNCAARSALMCRRKRFVPVRLPTGAGDQFAGRIPVRNGPRRRDPRHAGKMGKHLRGRGQSSPIGPRPAKPR